MNKLFLFIIFQKNLIIIIKVEEESQKEREKLMENYTLNNLKKTGIKRR